MKQYLLTNQNALNKVSNSLLEFHRFFLIYHSFYSKLYQTSFFETALESLNTVEKRSLFVHLEKQKKAKNHTYNKLTNSITKQNSTSEEMSLETFNFPY